MKKSEADGENNYGRVSSCLIAESQQLVNRKRLSHRYHRHSLPNRDVALIETKQSYLVRKQLVPMAVTVHQSVDDDASPFMTAANGYLLPGVYMPGDAVLPSVPAKQKKQRKSTLALQIRKLACLMPSAGSIEQPAKAAIDAAAVDPVTAWQCAGGFSLATYQSVEQAAARSHQINQLSPLYLTNSGTRLHNRRASLVSIELKPIPETPSCSSHMSEGDWYETYSVFSNEAPVQKQPQEQQLPLPPSGNWIPESPLLFAEPGLRFVPVPKTTGFTGYWEVDKSRTTPHPQPIDIMIGANMLVRRVHKSIAGMEIREAEGQLTISGQPTFIPPGFPSVYCEVYDKTNSTVSSWTPRRDLKLGSCHGKVYMTDTNMLVLRVESRTAFTNKVEYIVEDYITLEEGGQVLVDRMCCYEVATGRRETQVQVARLRPDKA